MRTKGVKISEDEVEKIKVMAEQGFDCTAIAKALNRCKETVRHVLHRRSIPYNRRPTGTAMPTDDYIQKIKELAKKGLPLTHIARKLGKYLTKIPPPSRKFAPRQNR